jgi:hypothetical protein
MFSKDNLYVLPTKRFEPEVIITSFGLLPTVTVAATPSIVAVATLVSTGSLNVTLI